jgi:hypothetical protein
MVLIEIEMPVENLHALEQIHALLQDKHIPWLVGGSCGLILQEVAITQPPRDLDIYVDTEDAILTYKALRSYATDRLVLSQTGIYSSLLSHFQIGNVLIEVVSGFEVHVEHSDYGVEISGFLDGFGASYDIKGRKIGLMPLAHELVFNMLRHRPDRYLAIAEKMRTNLTYYLTPLNKIIERNTFSSGFLNKLKELL